MNKKGEFGIKNFVLGMLLFSAVFALFNLYVLDMNSAYSGNIVDESFNSTFNKFENTKSNVEDMYAEVRANSAFTFLGVANIVLRSFVGVVEITYSAIADFSDLLVGFGTQYGIPEAVSSVIMTTIWAGVVILIVFLIINAIATRGSGRL